MTDISEYGAQGAVTPAYYRVRSFNPMLNTYQILMVRIDELGSEEFAGYGKLAEGEAITDVMTVDDAKQEHMAPAIREAEENERRWRESRPPPGRAPRVRARAVGPPHTAAA